jgi:ribonuclease VapC
MRGAADDGGRLLGLAILEEEPEAEHFISICKTPAAAWPARSRLYETGIVLGGRRGWEIVAELDALLDQLGIEIVPFTEPQIAAALDAYSRYGKGVDPKARLNLGDCAASALAKSMNAPLLFKGEDFKATDVLMA